MLPWTVLYRPDGQSVQELSPEVVPYLPEGHNEQDADPIEAKDPAGQVTQADAAVLPVFGFAVPDGQEMHEDWPVADWYDPAGHKVQVDDEVAAMAELNRPAGHFVQLDA